MARVARRVVAQASFIPAQGPPLCGGWPRIPQGTFSGAFGPIRLDAPAGAVSVYWADSPPRAPQKEGEQRAAVQAPLKRGLSPPPGGDWGFLASCRGRGEGRGKKPSVTASPCHLPFQGRFWRADNVRPYEWREVAGNCMFPSIYSQKLSPAAQKSGQGVSNDTPCPFFAF